MKLDQCVYDDKLWWEYLSECYHLLQPLEKFVLKCLSICWQYFVVTPRVGRTSFLNVVHVTLTLLYCFYFSSPASSQVSQDNANCSRTWSRSKLLFKLVFSSSKCLVLLFNLQCFKIALYFTIFHLLYTFHKGPC